MIKMLVGVALSVAMGWGPVAWAQSKAEKIDQLIGLHDLKTTVAIGNYFLKQETLSAVRGRLHKLGRENRLGADWKPGNLHWHAAESAMVDLMMAQAYRDFSNFEWLLPEWRSLSDQEFAEEELDVLRAHFATEVGRKQLQITDHGVAFHVMAALTLGGRMQSSVKGAEAERREMTHLYEQEDREMRFDINENPEGVRFAMSPVGKKYFVNAVLKVTGRISQRLYQTANDMTRRAEGAAAAAQPAIEAFKAASQG
ncbi:MAG: hypothetical protein FJY37_14105 [Betaproteobacteria bacterium]|nr:hypothetical protein [Betaproteobacteria bacterium]